MKLLCLRGEETNIQTVWPAQKIRANEVGVVAMSILSTIRNLRQDIAMSPRLARAAKQDPAGGWDTTMRKEQDGLLCVLKM